MGVNSSRLPSGNNYTISYCKQYNVPLCVKSKEINLIQLLDGYPCDTIMDLVHSVFYYKIKNLGYSIKSRHRFSYFKYPLNDIISAITKTGFYTSDNTSKLTDLEVTSKCYYPNIDNINYLLSGGNILIAGIIVDKEFGEVCLNTVITDLVTDIVIIVGITQDGIILKTTWYPEYLIINNRFIDNIKEIWNIDIKSPEDKFIDED